MVKMQNGRNGTYIAAVENESRYPRYSQHPHQEQVAEHQERERYRESVEAVPYCTVVRGTVQVAVDVLKCGSSPGPGGSPVVVR